ncbi:hypothetical protein ABEW05_001161 [Botrytis cinerea]
MPMSIRSAAASRAGGRPAAVHRAVAPSSPGSGSYRSLRSSPRSVKSRSNIFESDGYDSDGYDSDGSGSYGSGSYGSGSYGSESSDAGREVTEDHSSANPHTSTRHQSDGRFDEVQAHVQDLEEDIADTRREWDNRGIDPSDMLLRIANHKQKLSTVASSETCRNPFLKLSFDGVDGSLKELEAQANVRKTREQEEMKVTGKFAERRENERIEKFERQQRFMQEQAAVKIKTKNEKEAKKKEKAEEEKRKRITKEDERREQKAKFAAAMIERKRSEKEEKNRKREQQTTERWKAYQKRTSREKAAINRDFERKATEKQERTAEEEAEYQAKVTEEARRYSAEKAYRKRAKAALGNTEEESRDRERKWSEAYARKAVSDQEKKLRKKLNKLEDERKKIENDLGLRR